MRLTALILALTLCLSVSAQKKTTREEYILQYKDLAVDGFQTYGIPASIKLAQGILESDCGNGRLAREGNNHFGIKCKKDWTGMTIAHDDDAPGECFRKYSSASDSWRDHSEYLDRTPRYQNLFALDPTDYKAWARTLREDGYATDPAYPDKLIKIIEENQLYLLDQGKPIPTEPAIAQQTPVEPAAPQPINPEVIDPDNYSVSTKTIHGYPVYRNNGTEFIIAQQGDSYASLSKLMEVSVAALAKFNDTTKDRALTEGEAVYLKNKARRSENGKVLHIVTSGDTMHSISQKYGIRLKRLSAMNRRPVSAPVYEGEQIRLM